MKRIEWLDIARAISILSIIMFHSVGGGIIFYILGAFCVPVFFVMSGIVYNDKDFSVVLRKKIKTLIVPYFIFVGLGLIITMIIPSWRAKFTIKDFVFDMIYADPNGVNVSSVWFLVCLFLVSLACCLILKLNKKIQYGLVVLISIVGFTFSYLYINKAISFRLPLNIDVALVAILFFMIGYWAKDVIKNAVDKITNSSVIIKVIILFVLAVIWIVVSYINGQVNFHALMFKNLLLYFISAFSAFAFVFIFSSILSQTCLKGIFSWIGKNSLYIMGFQAIAVRLFILLVNGIFNKNFVLYDLPFIYAMVSFVFSTVVSLLLVYIYTSVKTMVLKGQEK